MTEKIRISHENFVAIAKDLVRLADGILKNVVAKTESAALEIGNKMESVSSLSTDQAKLVKSLLSNMYEDGSTEHDDIKDLADETNNIVDKIFNSANEGDLETVEKLGDSAHYKSLGKKAGNLSKQLEKLSESDKELANMIAPVIMALQFQDSIKQQLENLIKCFAEFEIISDGISEKKLPKDLEKKLWDILETKLTSIEEINTLRKIIYGENAELVKAVTKEEDSFLF